MLDYFGRKHISELFGFGFLLDQSSIIFLGNIFLSFIGKRFLPDYVMLNHFFLGSFLAVDFSWNRLDYFSKKYIFELFGSGFLLDQH